MFFCVYFYFLFFKFFLLAASFDGLRPLLVACHCQPFCSLANKLRSFVRMIGVIMKLQGRLCIWLYVF